MLFNDDAQLSCEKAWEQVVPQYSLLLSSRGAIHRANYLPALYTLLYLQFVAYVLLLKSDESYPAIGINPNGIHFDNTRRHISP